MSLSEAERKKIKRYSLSGLNKPKKTPKHPSKKGIVAGQKSFKPELQSSGNKVIESAARAAMDGVKKGAVAGQKRLQTYM